MMDSSRTDNSQYMRYFYEMYPNALIRPQAEDDLGMDENCPQVGDNLKMIFRTPWGHNKTKYIDGMFRFEKVMR